MKSAVICVVFVLLLVGVSHAQTKTMTTPEPSARDERRAERGGQVKSIGSHDEGREVPVFYTKIDNTFDYNGVNTWLAAVRIVEVKVSGVQSNDGFYAFYAAFRKAVLKNDRSAIRAMMSPRFEWASDGYVSRDEALQTMDRNKRWVGLRNAVARRPVPCKQPYCNNRAGYRIWSSPKFRFETMFERGADGQWKWSAVLGD